MNITLTINDAEYTAQDNATVLDVCLANGIDVPRLCDCPGISDVGSCRMCVVEIEGERRPVPSCTYPVRNGLVVQTSTEKLEKYRRQILELLFTERNHFCMFCEVSGDCELQKLAYRYQMDHVRYEYKYPELDLDTLSEYLVVDHNRCILCGRCVRVCEEVAASQTIGFTKRGWETKVAADLQQSLGNSSCRLCGACIQSCPTGAIMNKTSYYRGTRDTCTETITTCPGCSVGCEINVLVKDNNIRRVEAPYLTTSIYGSLCRMGRFELADPKPERVKKPLVRNAQGELQESSMEEATAVISGKLAGKKTAGIVSSKLPTETLKVFKDFVKNAAGGGPVDTLDGGIYRAIASGVNKIEKLFDEEGSVKDITEADYILLVGADPQTTNPVISTVIRRTVNKTGAKLAIINEEVDVLPMWSYMWLNPKKNTEVSVVRGLIKVIVDLGLNRGRLNMALEEELKNLNLSDLIAQAGVSVDDLKTIARDFSQAEKAMIIYGDAILSGDLSIVSCIDTLAAITGNPNGIMSLKPAINSRGAWSMGLAEGIEDNLQAVYLLLGDDAADDALLKQVEGSGCLVVQASYISPATEKADVVLPSPIWAERSGSYTTLDGRLVKAQSVLKPVDGCMQDEDVLKMIAQKLGQKIS